MSNDINTTPTTNTTTNMNNNTIGSVINMIRGERLLLDHSVSNGMIVTIYQHPLFRINESLSFQWNTNSNKFMIHDYGTCIYDGIDTVRCSILDKHNYPIPPMSLSIKLVQILGYVTSMANLHEERPMICITKVQIIKEIKNFKPKILDMNVCQLKQGRVFGNRMYVFLSTICPYLSFDALAGCYRSSSIPSIFTMTTTTNTTTTTSTNQNHSSNPNDDSTTNVTLEQKLEIITDFLLHHHAMTILSNTQQQSNGTTTTDHIPNHMVQIYQTVVSTFYTKQMELQTTSISPSVKVRQTLQQQCIAPNMVTQNHQSVLEQIITHQYPWDETTTSTTTTTNNNNNNHQTTTDDITMKMLHWCHSKLCQGIIPDAGIYRDRSVRVGTTSFVYDTSMTHTMSLLLSSLQTLRQRMIQQQQLTSTAPTSSHGQSNTNHNYIDQRTIEQQRLLSSITYAAAVCMGILDTHPYADGNGRLARLITNWILYHQVHIPFVINFFTTPSQRATYMKAICRTRRNICLLPVGDVPDDLLLESYERFGVFFPMVELIVDRIYRGVLEFQSMVHDKLSSHTQEEQDRAARMIRTQSATGTCQICFDERPNITTLCCGSAIHLNCLGKWLMSHTSCPNCRSELPKLFDGATQQLSDLVPVFEEFRRLYHDIGSNAENDPGAFDHDSSPETEYETSVYVEEDDNHDTEMEDGTYSIPDTECTYCNNLRARDCINAACRHCCEAHGDSYCHRHHQT